VRLVEDVAIGDPVSWPDPQAADDDDTDGRLAAGADYRSGRSAVLLRQE